jgi:hypothetical protein
MDEITKAIKSLKNEKSAGPDVLSNFSGKKTEIYTCCCLNYCRFAKFMFIMPSALDPFGLRLGVWCFTPFSTIFQLYRGGQLKTVFLSSLPISIFLEAEFVHVLYEIPVLPLDIP